MNNKESIKDCVKSINNCLLTKEQLKTTNGCGSSYFLARPFRIPKWISKSFFNCCNFHDVGYTNNTVLINKWEADDNLLNCMYYSAFHSSWWQKRIKLKVADFVYFCLSTKLSDKCFEKAESKS